VIEPLWSQLFITRIFALLRCYAAHSCRRVGTTYRSSSHGSSSPNLQRTLQMAGQSDAMCV